MKRAKILIENTKATKRSVGRLGRDSTIVATKFFMHHNNLSLSLPGFVQSFTNGSLISEGMLWRNLDSIKYGIQGDNWENAMNRVPHATGEGRGHAAGTEVTPPYDRVRLATPHDFWQKKRCSDFRRVVINNSKSSTYIDIQSLSRDYFNGYRSTCSCFLFLNNAYRNAPNDLHHRRCCL